jgi:5S rRNA maturation endonuclease (ribonuclease M5)
VTKPIDLVLSRLKGTKETKNGWDALCPAHDDHNPSLGVKVMEDGTVLIKCRSRACSLEAICKAIGLEVKDLFPNKLQNGSGKAHREIVATYDYVDGDGKLLFQVVRFDPKDFQQRRPDPTSKGGWIWDLKGVSRVLYRLPEILKAVANHETIFVPEGEKDVNNLVKIGLVATTNAGGAGKWKPEYADTLRSANVIILPDNDNAGQKHAHQVASSLQGEDYQAREPTEPSAERRRERLDSLRRHPRPATGDCRGHAAVDTSRWRWHLGRHGQPQGGGTAGDHHHRGGTRGQRAGRRRTRT